MSATQLASGIQDALGRKTACRIAVHNSDQIQLGQIAARRMASRYGGNADNLTFEMIPEAEQEIYPVGTILV